MMRPSSLLLIRKNAVRLLPSSVGGAEYHRPSRMKHWPRKREIPENFAFTPEQRYRAKSIPRDTGKIPKDFVLSILYRHQPCEVSDLWSFCLADPRIVLDGKRHLREVLQQLRAEGYVTFEKNLHSQKWEGHLTRERYEDVRRIVKSALFSVESSDEASFPPAIESSLNTEAVDTPLESLSASEKAVQLETLEKELALTTQKLAKYQFVEIDYLPYTDLNGKVKFMWWYETSSLPPQEATGLLEEETTPKLEGNKP